MKLKIIVESKNFEDNKELHNKISEDPCKYCFLGKGIMCIERKYCQWPNLKEIYIKKEIKINVIIIFLKKIVLMICEYLKNWMK
jgi:hypothetical protein